ncbi:MAG TPA: HAD-IA family hydrolase [Candidatus Polarisedimenticolia bacterium]|nr:HAD-IA family hydrolase [Candidatus Polarisedimenticolia bacterium]
MTAPSTAPLREARAFTFDCYGTLVDWERGLLDELRPWAAPSRATDEQLLAAFAAAESSCEQESPSSPYPDILRAAHGRIARSLGLPPDHLAAEALARSVGSWPPFADAPAALAALGRRARLVVVSNVDRRSFEATQRALGARFDAVVTAEEVGAYKPDRRMFDRALAVLAGMGIAPFETIHVAQSLYHDHAPAIALGLRTVWVDRRAGRQGGATPAPPAGIRPTWTVGSLAELAGMVCASG